MSVAELAPRAPSSELSETLRTGPDRFEKLLNDAFADMEAMCAALEEQRIVFETRCRRLEEEKHQLAEALAERPAGEGAQLDRELQSKVTELERDRQLLEQELEEVRVRSTDLAKTLTEQKRQMADERAEWTAELRQLRRVLDKQASWIAQQSRAAPADLASIGETDSRLASLPQVAPHNASLHPVANGNTAAAAPQNRDPVLGSVMSQFELLRKDLERRRSQSGAAGK